MIPIKNRNIRMIYIFIIFIFIQFGCQKEQKHIAEKSRISVYDKDFFEYDFTKFYDKPLNNLLSFIKEPYTEDLGPIVDDASPIGWRHYLYPNSIYMWVYFSNLRRDYHISDDSFENISKSFLPKFKISRVKFFQRKLDSVWDGKKFHRYDKSNIDTADYFHIYHRDFTRFYQKSIKNLFDTIGEPLWDKSEPIYTNNEVAGWKFYFPDNFIVDIFFCGDYSKTFENKDSIETSVLLKMKIKNIFITKWIVNYLFP